ncbi:MAG: PA0069 family radical SAM protein [Chitinophagales bacterium]|nr:PA0069 family radical SAM protein [Chitinophagales bacterium]
MDVYVKGRGSQKNPANKFLQHSSEVYLDDLATEEERAEELTRNPKTKYIEVFPKTILNKVDSPDLGFSWSMNPYQGCEHGCIYCYARNTHEYWGYSAGRDFEENILVKKNAPELLRQTLLSKKWKAEPVTIAGNTDCYQPAERKLKITRQCLEVFLELQHPVGIITKNSLIERDTDLLKQLAEKNLTVVVLSLTTLNQALKSVMEPRTSSVKNILQTINRLSSAGIPVHVNTAPIIPAINDEEIFDLVKAVADAGAVSVAYIVVRLNGHNGLLFEGWVRKNFPDRANKVLNQIKTMHGGNLNDSQYGRRMKGDGNFAELIKQQYLLAKLKFMSGRKLPALDYGLFEERRTAILHKENLKGQMELF